jgi:hypothetical protein
MYYERALIWMHGFELDSSGTAQGLLTAPCKPDNEFSEFHKRPGNLLNRCVAIGYSKMFYLKHLRKYGGWNFELINQILYT